MYELYILQYDRIDISEGIDVNLKNASKECDICHYWYFKDIGFKYDSYLCNGCHDLMQKAMNFNDVTIVYVKESAYRIHFWYMSKDDAINTMNNSNLNEKRGVLLNFFSLIYKKWVIQLTIRKTRDVILNRAKDYYENDKEILKQQARNKYRNLPEEEKIKRERENMEEIHIIICLKKKNKN